ncbi:fungal hydrophobin, partial [Wolfiporia cocos MD-104 SS10]
QCNTGPVQCCDSLERASAPRASSLLAALGVMLGDEDTLVGMGCSNAGVDVLGGNSCDATPVCCENNTFNGLINIGCSPIIINL